MLQFLLSVFKTPTVLLNSLLNQHKGVRRGLVIWAAMQVQWVIHRVFEHMDQLTAIVVSMTTIIVAPLVGLIVYYVHLRSVNDGDDDSSPPPGNPPT